MLIKVNQNCYESKNIYKAKSFRKKSGDPLATRQNAKRPNNDSLTFLFKLKKEKKISFKLSNKSCHKMWLMWLKKDISPTTFSDFLLNFNFVNLL